MAFKTPRFPVKRSRSPSVDTPSVHSTDQWPSSSLSHMSPTPHVPSHPPKRVSLAPPRQRTSSVASPVPSSKSTAYQMLKTHASAKFDPGQGVDAAEEDEILEERIMAVDMRDKGSIGCCYYVAATEGLYLLEDVKSGGLDIIDQRISILRGSLKKSLTKDSQIAHRAHCHTHLSQNRRECGCPLGPRRPKSRSYQWRW